MNLADALISKAYDDGELIIMQGDTGDGMYFVEEGTVRVTMTKDDNQETEVCVRACVRACVCVCSYLIVLT